MNKEYQEEFFQSLTLIDDEARPLAGTDITGRNQHQYTRLALVKLPAGNYKFSKYEKDRIFVVFAESSWLYNAIHEKLNTPNWIQEGFDEKFIYIEEILHRPRTGETLNEYTSYIPQTENDLWIALFNYIVVQGLLEKSARKLVAKTYRLPSKE